jgi:hypothetical protein
MERGIAPNMEALLYIRKNYASMMDALRRPHLFVRKMENGIAESMGKMDGNAL